MISEEQQEQASLYALGLLSAEERSAFEQELAANQELQTLVDELGEAAAAVAWSAPQSAPSPELRARVLREIAGEAERVIPLSPAAGRRSLGSGIPWAIAAALAVFCGLLLKERAQLQQQVATERSREAKPVLVALAPSEKGPAEAKALVAWDAAQQSGTIQISHLPAASGEQDYELWAIDAAHPDPVSAGLVRVDASGEAHAQFRPSAHVEQVKAFAISLERKGGSPGKPEGPILLVGNA